jgi:hypothetical protein
VPPIALLVLLADPFPVATDAQLAEVFGEGRLAIVRGATRVEAVRLTGEFDQDPHSTRKHIDRWPAKGPTVTLSRPLADRAIALASANSSFSRWGSRCFFTPGVRLRFHKDDQHLDVLLCFKCGDVAISKPEARFPEKVMGYAELGDYVSMMGFMPGYDAWLGLAREIFPKDADLKGLKRPFGRD